MIAYVSYSSQGKNEEIVSNLKKAQSIADRSNDTVIHAINYQLKAKYYHLNNDRSKAFKYALLANEYSRNKNPATYDNSLTILGDIAFQNGNYNSAISYYNEILQRGKERKIEPIYITEDYLSIALANARINEYEIAKQYYDSANLILKENHYSEVYFHNMVNGFFKMKNKQFKEAIELFDKEIKLLGYYNLLYIKKAEAFHHLGMKDSVIANLKIVEKNIDKQSIFYDYDSLKEYFPLKIKYSEGEVQDSIINEYAKFTENSLKGNKTLVIQESRHYSNISKLKNEKNKILEKERNIKIAFISLSIIFILLIIIIAFYYVNRKKRLELIFIKKEFETSKQERNRISQELHDDLGANFTSISLARKILESKLNLKDFKELEIIFRNTKDIYLKLTEIVWSMDNNNDKLLDLVLYTKKFLKEFLSDQNIGWNVIHSDQINKSDITLTTNERKQLFLSIKEIVNNSIKHSEATELTVDFQLIDTILTITITDNGKGFNTAIESVGNK